MNATQPYGGSQSHHGYMEGHHQPPSSNPPGYQHYPVQVPAPILQPTVSSYAQPQGYYPYGAPAPGSHYSHPPLNLPTMTSAPTSTAVLAPNYETRSLDQTGQIAPPGRKPKITATLWEDEGTVCFQVEVEGICVARRSDNSMINGTKLLNVARMTRGRRDGILKSEKHRKVIKIGPMHLKGVWIPFDRALEFANKEKITEQLYPLFVNNVETHLHQPQLAPGANVMNHRRGDSRGDAYSRTSASQTPVVAQLPNMQSPHPMNNTSGRPGLDRAQTFPTPPTSANPVGMSSSGSSYEWGNHGMPTHPLSVDTGLSHSKTMPTTPASTPPENLHMQYPTAQPVYDSRPPYSAPPVQPSPYSIPPIAQYGYGKTDMAPPARTNTQPEQILPKEEDEPHDGSSYVTDRAYTYDPHAVAGQQDQGRPATDSYKSSPGSGRATPRTLGYATPQMNMGPSEHRAPTHGYPLGAPITTQYLYPLGNESRKRVHDAEDEDLQSKEGDLKRRRTMHEDHNDSQHVMPAPLGHLRSTIHRH